MPFDADLALARARLHQQIDDRLMDAERRHRAQMEWTHRSMGQRWRWLEVELRELFAVDRRRRVQR